MFFNEIEGRCYPLRSARWYGGVVRGGGYVCSEAPVTLPESAHPHSHLDYNILLLWQCQLGKASKKKSIFLGKSPKLWVGWGQES